MPSAAVTALLMARSTGCAATEGKALGVVEGADAGRGRDRGVGVEVERRRVEVEDA